MIRKRSCPVWREAVGKGPAQSWHLAGGPPDPKADGRLRPLGIATLEDKIVQRAVVEVLNAVYSARVRVRRCVVEPLASHALHQLGSRPLRCRCSSRLHCATTSVTSSGLTNGRN